MKIYSKLLLGIGGVVLALLGVMAIVIGQIMTVVKFKDVANEASGLVQSWDAVQLGAQNLLLAAEQLETLESRWTIATSNFETSLSTLNGDSRIDALGAGAREQMTNTVNLWELTKSQIQSATTAFSEFKQNVAQKHPALLELGTDGLQEKISSLEKENSIAFIDLYYFTTFKNAIKNVMLANESFKAVLRKMDVAVQERVNEVIRKTVFIGILLTALAIIIAFLYINAFSRRLAKRAQIIEAAMRRVASRDFSVRPKQMGTDEIGLLSAHLGEVVDSLSAFFTAVKGASEKVTGLKDALSAGTAQSAAAVNEINKNIEGIKNRFVVLDSAINQSTMALGDIGRYLESFKGETNKQALSMEHAGTELSEAVESVSSVSRDISERAHNADKLKRVVLDGGERVQATNEVIRTISRDIEGIAEIIELIDQISEQTNILSMNAAIESAHAGAAGKGFAVVAEEIRKLAESTQDNAQRIGEALTSITDKISVALDTSESSARAFDSINEDVNGFVVELEKIAERASQTSAESVQVVTAIKDSIAATKRVSDGTVEMYERHRAIQDAMENIKSISDEALAGITEIDLGSKEILDSVVHVDEISLQSRERAAELESAMSGFKTAADIDGDAEDGQDESGDKIDDRGVAVKKKPRIIGKRAAAAASASAETSLHAGDVSADARLL